MLEMTAEIDDKEILDILKRIERAGGRLPLKRFAVVGTKSINKNFRMGGRPDKWAPLKAGKGARKRGASGRFVKGTSHRRAGGKPLLDTTSLQKSVHAEYLGLDNVKIVTKHPVAPHHQYGTGTFGKRGAPYMIRPKNTGVLRFITSGGSTAFSLGHLHPGVVARPFIGWQEEDGVEIQKIAGAHLMKLGGIL